MFYRAEHNANYTCVDNGFLRDKELSLRARGLLATILSEPDTWQFSVAGFETILPDGKTAIRNAVKELEERGYIVRRGQARDDSGKLGLAEWDVYEDPSMNPAKQGRSAESSQLGTVAQNPPTALSCDDVEKAQVGTVGGFTVGGERAQLIPNESNTAVKCESCSSSDGGGRPSTTTICSPGYPGNNGNHVDQGIIDAASRVIERGNDVMGLDVKPGDDDLQNLLCALEAGMDPADCVKAIEFCAATWSVEAREHLCYRTVFKPGKMESYAAKWSPKHKAIVDARIRKRQVPPEKIPDSIECPHCHGQVTEKTPNGLFFCSSCNTAVNPRPG